ncbi:hypothetical protein [Natronosalvus rutilus]|uniref:Uncharacterized protein n=1 Tax=Natronosalvus rutilus TaxID=2953753 RepID=A0A9E7NBF7_9EURY|nr:hypothetical protein [Natronosalvus rutilus]UTF55349.1 hypothetical protein NGM29_08905 [Natronosalvus rutilus]
MTDERSITRRDSLKRIAASGALLGGTGFATGTVSAGEGMADNIRLVASCYEEDRSKFRVDNHNKKTVKVTWDVYGTDQSGSLKVSGKDSVYFWVDADHGDATVRLFYDGEQIDVKHANDQKVCAPEDPKEAIDLEPACYIDERVYNGENDVTVDPDGTCDEATYCFTLTVGDDADGNSLNEIEADFCGSGVDVSNVDDDDVSVELNGDDVTDDLDEVDDDDDGETLTLEFDGDCDLEEGDEIRVCLDNVKNPAEAGVYTARFTLNDEESSVSAFTIGNVDDGSKGKKKKKGDHFPGMAKFCVHNEFYEDVEVVWRSTYMHQGGLLTIPARGTRCFWADLDKKGKAHVKLLYDDEQVDEADANTDERCTPNPHKIRFRAICHENGRARFRVFNYNQQTVPVSWSVDDDDDDDDDCDYDGSGYVPAMDSLDVWVDVDDDDDDVTLSYLGEELDTDEVAEKVCGPENPKEAIDLDGLCYRPGKGKKPGKARFAIHNCYDYKVRVTWKSAYTKEADTIKLDVGETHYFWVDLDKKGKAMVNLYFNNKKIDEADADTDTLCEEYDD